MYFHTEAVPDTVLSQTEHTDLLLISLSLDIMLPWESLAKERQKQMW